MEIVERKVKIEYLENKKSFFDKKKKHISWFLKGYHLVKQQKFEINSGGNL